MKYGFKKINSLHYEYTVTKEDFDKLDRILETLSNGKIDEYLDVHNMNLFDNMLARHVATLFLDTGEVVDNNYGMAVIYVKLEDRSFKVTVAKIPITKEDERVVSGIIYE